MARTSPPLQALLARRREWLDHQAQGKGAVRRQALHDIEDQGRSEQRVRSDYRGRYPMELLQNAHDALADGGMRGKVEFVVTHDALLVANQGLPFDAQRIGALVRLGTSDKVVRKGHRRAIGYKGVGFTSVFEISETPQCVSRDVAFCFDQARARQLVHDALGLKPGAVPARGFPFEMQLEELGDDAATVQELLDEGAVTVIRLPFRNDLSAQDVSQEIESALLPEVLLFMPALTSLSVVSSWGRVAWSCTFGRKIGSGRLARIESTDGRVVEWLTLGRAVPVPRELVLALDDPLWTGITHLNVAAAFPWKRGPNPDAEPAALHVYYPTNDRLDRSVLIHGDFYVKSDRRRIEGEKAGGEVSRFVAQHAARAVADLAESIADKGNALLRTLAPSGRLDGFGVVVAGLIDEELRKRKILRTSTGGRRAPGDVKFVWLDEEPSTSDWRAMSRMIGRRSHVVVPGDEAGVEGFLSNLGAEALDNEQLAELLVPSRRREHEPDLGVLARWVGTIDSAEHEAVVEVLRTKPMLRDTRGSWRRPDQLALRVGELPVLPRCIAQTEMRPLRNRSARELVRLIGVSELDARRALQLAVEAAEGQLEDSDWKEIHDFVLALWRRQERTVSDAGPRLGTIRVRAAGSSTTEQWVPARNTYFSSEWLGTDDLERIYGPSRRPEFLAVAPPKRGRDRLMAFYRILGVSDAPRFTVTTPWAGQGPSSVKSWYRAVGEGRGPACDQHPQSQRVRITTIDRLEEIITDGLTRPRATALANVLARHGDPFGKEDEAYCQAQSHRGGAPRKSLPGFQAWLLNTTAWLPIRTLDGSGVLAKPRGAWLVEDRRDGRRLLPRAQVSREAGQALRLPTPTHPTIEALEDLLRALAEAFPVLGDARLEAQETALWAQRSLDRLLRQSSPRSKSFAFAVEQDGTSVWEAFPVANDLPGGTPIPGAALLSAPNEHLTRVYALDKASDVVSINVVAGPRRRAVVPVSQQLKEAIVALAAARGLDAQRAAVRLEVLAQRAVDGLSLEVSSRGTKRVVRRASYLDVRRDARGAVRDGVLYRDENEAPNVLVLAEQVAAYLDLGDISELIALLLTSSGDVLAREGIGEIELSDAASTLRGVRRHVPVEDDAVDVDRAAGGSEPPVATGATSLSPAGGARPRDPADGVETEPAVGPEPDLIGEDVTFGPVKPGGRKRPRKLDVDGDTPTSGVDGKHTRPRRRAGLDEVEALAVSLVMRLCDELGVEVRDVQRENRGWDLELTYPDGSLRRVEVKGTSGDGPLILTRRERAAALEDPDYELMWVANVTDAVKASLRIFRHLGRHLRTGALEAMSWEVSDWSAMPYEERAIRVVDRTRV
jgi:hypothetical protein